MKMPASPKPAARAPLTTQGLRLALELLLARHALALIAIGLPAVVLLWLTLAQLPAQGRELASLRARVKAPPPVVKAAPPQDPMAPFRAVLQPDDAKMEVARALWNDAAAAGLQPARVDYRNNPSNAAGFSRFDLTLPVAGPPDVIRQFAFSLLERHPGLALEKIELQREAAVQDQVEAQLAFVLLLEAPK
ncbi:hypothetical protein [Niveibacterium sp.]|uniref:hypothetical protein n=1 Tax=Niveibacterium sp. TaxID=2017444 RepID=UPI0035B4550C